MADSTDLSATALSEFLKVALKKEATDPNLPPMSEAHIFQLVGFLRSTDVEAQRLASELCGDMSRTEAGRYTVQSAEASTAIKTISHLLYHSDEEIQTNAIRLLGNLCFNNPEARKQIEAVEGSIKQATTFLLAENAKKLRMTCGFIANITSATENLAVTIAGFGIVIPRLVQLINHQAIEVATMATRAIANMTANTNIGDMVAHHGGLNALVSILAQSDDPDLVNEVTVAIGSVIDTSDALLSKFVNEYNGIELLLRTNSTFEDEEDLAKAVFEVLQQIAEKAEHRMKFITEKAHLRLLQMAKQAGSPVITSYALKVIGNLAAGDEIATILFTYIDQWIQFLKVKDNEVRLSAMLIIANLARSDENCVSIIKHGAGEWLIAILDEPEDKNDTRPITMAAGALKNLALYAPNKQALLNAGVLPRACKLLESETPMVVYCGIGIIKMLLNGGAQYAKALFQDTHAVKHLIKASFEEDPEAATEAHVLYEAARTVSLFASLGPEFGKFVVESTHGLKAYATLLKSKFAVLQLEALESLASVARDHQALIAKYPGVLEAIVAVASKEEQTAVSDKPAGPNDANPVPAALGLLNILADSNDAKQFLKDAKVDEVAKGLQTSAASDQSKKLAADLASKLP